MATNKNALIRYKVLDRCFRNTGKRYFIQDLINECNLVLSKIDPNFDGISRRQIFEDLSFMESEEGWAIELKKERDGKKVFYRYFDPTFSINNMPLNAVEIDQLQSALDILSQFKGMPQFEWVHELVPKLKQGIPDEEQKESIIEFDNNQYLKGIENIGPLYNAILYKTAIKVEYQPFENDQPFSLELHPYYLKQYNNRWFVFGYNPKNKKYDWNLALDRIKEIIELKTKYHENQKINWAEYFEDFIGVTKPVDGKSENIILHFFGRTANYMESKPLHGSQKSKWIEKETLEVSLNLMINYELERLILSYADSVRVISPKSLVLQIKKRLENSRKLY